MKRQNKLSSKILMWVLALFFYAPIIYAIVFSFNEGKSLTNFTGFSLQWYGKMFRDREMKEAVFYTIVIAALATVLSTLFGTVAAIGLSKSNKGLKFAVEQINNLPIMNPDIVTAIGLLVLFATLHFKNGFGTMLLAHVMFCTPYVILSVMPRLRGLDPNLAEAAMAWPRDP
jgi:spermidine/putrescine transport system permease protein